MLRLALIDRHAMFRGMLAREFGSDVLQAADVPGALPHLTGDEMVVLHPRDCSEVELLCGSLGQPRVLVLLDLPESQLVQRVLRLGVRGVITVRASVEELKQALEVVQQGGLYLHPEVARMGSFFSPDGEATPGLDEREVELIRLVSAGRTNEQIARALKTTAPSVKWAIRTLCQRLGAEDRVHLVTRAMQLGYVTHLP